MRFTTYLSKEDVVSFLTNYQNEIDNDISPVRSCYFTSLIPTNIYKRTGTTYFDIEHFENYLFLYPYQSNKNTDTNTNTNTDTDTNKNTTTKYWPHNFKIDKSKQIKVEIKLMSLANVYYFDLNYANKYINLCRANVFDEIKYYQKIMSSFHLLTSISRLYLLKQPVVLIKRPVKQRELISIYHLEYQNYWDDMKYNRWLHRQNKKKSPKKWIPYKFFVKMFRW